MACNHRPNTTAFPPPAFLLPSPCGVCQPGQFHKDLSSLSPRVVSSRRPRSRSRSSSSSSNTSTPLTISSSSSSPPSPTPPSPSPSSSPSPRSSRDVDARGFLLPKPGDVVLYAGRWPSEDAAGVVESIRFLSARSAHVVDVAPLRRVGAQLFIVPSKARRERSKWFDVADVRVVSDAEYLPSQDGYHIPSARDGYAELTPAKLASLSEQKVASDLEYATLQKALLVETAIASAAGTVLMAALFGINDASIPAAYTAGATAGFVYLLLLQKAVDAMGIPTSSLAQRFLVLRFIVPVIPFAAVAWTKLQHGAGIAATTPVTTENWSVIIASISKLDALAIVLGLLTYKVPLLRRTLSEFVDGLSELEVGKTGMLGTVAGIAARRIKRSSSSSLSSSSSSSGRRLAKRKRMLIFAGPSGAGKSTLMHRLLNDSPDKFAYSVSHTTRPKREGEEDGRDYYFVSSQEFDEMVARDEFVEYATVHGVNKYGTSLSAVNRVEGICLLDLDVQGVETVRRKQIEQANIAAAQGRGQEQGEEQGEEQKDNYWNWDARFIWVAPPSLYALEERLRDRGTESEQTIGKRLRNATKELAYAATSDAFDLILVNDDVERAVGELDAFIKRTCREWDRAEEEKGETRG